MATPIGTNAVNSISRRVLHPQLIDNVYNSNPLFFRMNALNKKVIEGGFQIEVPQIFTRFTNGGPFQGYDLLDISPNDTVKNAAWDWRQYFVPVSIDNLSLTRADHPEAVANLLAYLFEQAEMEMAENLGNDLYSDATTNTKALDGLKGAVDNGTVAATYGGLVRSSNPWWNCQIDSSTTTTTALAIRSLMGLATAGGRHPTIHITTQFLYNRYWNLLQPNQAFPVQPAGSDEQLAQGGFTNLLFDGVPVLVDSHVPTSHWFMLNERYIWLYVKQGVDFKLNDFVQPPNQDAYTSLITWYGQLIVVNPSRQAKFTALTA